VSYTGPPGYIGWWYRFLGVSYVMNLAKWQRNVMQLMEAGGWATEYRKVIMILQINRLPSENRMYNGNLSCTCL
jgi:hypothetical protein